MVHAHLALRGGATQNTRPTPHLAQDRCWGGLRTPPSTRYVLGGCCDLPPDRSHPAMWRREVLSASARGDAILTRHVARRDDLTRTGSRLRGRVERVHERRCGECCHAAACTGHGLGSRGSFIPDLMRRTQATDGAGDREKQQELALFATPAHARIRRARRGRMRSDTRRAATPPSALGASWEARGVLFLT